MSATGLDDAWENVGAPVLVEIAVLQRTGDVQYDQSQQAVGEGLVQKLEQSESIIILQQKFRKVDAEEDTPSLSVKELDIA